MAARTEAHVMQMHVGITGHTQIVYAFCGVVKSKLHPLSAVSLGMGQGGFTAGRCCASRPFNLLSTTAGRWLGCDSVSDPEHVQ